MQRKNVAGAVLVLALIAIVAWILSGPIGKSEDARIAVTEQDGTEKVLPFVDGGDPANPISGSESDNDPRTPPVYGGQITKSWTELDALLGAEASYTDCMDHTLGMKWKDDVPRFKITESEGFRTTFITAILTTASDEAIRAIAKRDDPTVNEKTRIIREDKGFINTRGIEAGGCEEFVDLRSVVRVSHGIVQYNADGTPKGLLPNRGIFTTCKNGWRFVKEVGPKPPPPGTTVVTTTPGKPQCEGPCTPTTTQPPGCTPPCKEQKIPGQDPGPQGKAGGNDGKNTDQSQGTYTPDGDMTRPPETPYQTQAPVVTPPPAPPVITPDPNLGQMPTVDPGTPQPPNHGTAPPTQQEPPPSGQPCNPFLDC